MQTSLKQLNPVEYELEIDATAADLAPQIKKRLREHQAGIALKGFRPGKVPIPLLKKMYGESLVIDVIEQSLIDIFRDEVVDSGDYKVIGRPVVEKMDYKLDGDLHAVMKFGVKPEISLRDVSGEEVVKLVHEVTEEEIEKEIDAMLLDEADLITREEGGITESDHVVIDMQMLDPGTATPIVGEREEDLSFFVDDEKLKKKLHDALIGKKAGESFRVTLALEDDDSARDEDSPRSDLLVLPGEESKDEGDFALYEVRIKEVQERVIPEPDEELIKEITRDEAEDEEGLREYVKKGLVRSWKNESRRLLEGEIMSKMLDMHDFPVPNSAVQMYLDSFVEDLRQEYGKELPEDFDVEAFKEERKSDAERLARWQFIRNHIIEEESIEVTAEDRKEYFADMAGSEEMAESLMNYYASMRGGNMLEQVDQELLSRKVMALLAERFDVEEKSKDDFMAFLKDRAAARESLQI